MHAVLLKFLGVLLHTLGFVAAKSWDILKWAVVQARLLGTLAVSLLTWASLHLTKYFVLRVALWAAIFVAVFTLFNSIFALIQNSGVVTLATVFSSVDNNFSLHGWAPYVWSGGICLASFFSWLRIYLAFWVSCEVAFRLFISSVALKRAGFGIWK